MSTLNPTRKVSRRQELRQDRVVTFYARAMELVDQNRNAVWAGAAVVIIAALAVVGFMFLQNQRQQTALDEMSEAVRLYEAGNHRLALDGTGNFLGLLDIVDEYGGTDAGNLAKFYAADALFRVGDSEAALPLFRDFDKGPDILGASALAGEAAILESQGDFGDAGDLYRRAAAIYDSGITSPGYLIAAGRAYEAAGDLSGAERVYEIVRDDYPDSAEARDIDFHLARVSQ